MVLGIEERWHLVMEATGGRELEAVRVRGLVLGARGYGLGARGYGYGYGYGYGWG